MTPPAPVAMYRPLAFLLAALTAAVPAVATPPDTTPQNATTPDTSRVGAAEDPPPRVQVGFLIQTIGSVSGAPDADPDGFTLESARLILEGETDVLAYELETDVADGFELQDVLAAYRPHSAATLKAGHFKPPFSRGELVSSSRTPFVDRPLVARALRPGRHVGVGVAAEGPGGVRVQGGVFDPRRPNDDGPDRTGGMLYAARATWRSAVAAGTLELGASGLYDDTDGGFGWRYGVDGRLRLGAATLTAEYLADPEPLPGSAPDGYFATAVYAVTPRHRLRARWDVLAAPQDTPDADAERLVGVGYTFVPPGLARVEVDYLVPARTGGWPDGTLLVNLQLSL